MTIVSLPDFILKPLVASALREDLGEAGDITTDALVAVDRVWQAHLITRQAGVIAGIDLARLAFTTLDPTMVIQVDNPDGRHVKPGDIIARLHGRARAILSAERVALNFLCHLSGVATATSKLVEAVVPHKARIACTRKTTPGLRTVEKYAVRVGGGSNHRFGLYDAILIKDNHIAVAGSLTAAVNAVRKSVGHLVKVEVEIDTLDQLREALPLPIDVVLLDNMTSSRLREAVELVNGRFMIEASGGINLETVGTIAATGVDIISSGALTHSAAILDIGLDEVTF